MTDDHRTKRKEKRRTDDVDMSKEKKRQRTSTVDHLTKEKKIERTEDVEADVVASTHTGRDLPSSEAMMDDHRTKGKEKRRRRRRTDDDIRRKVFRAKWSVLPTELLELILRNLLPSDILGFKDILSFKAVCHSWRNAAKSFSSYSPTLLQTPWLLLHINNKSSLFDLAGKKVHKIKNVYDGFPNARCVGTSHGWMVMFDKVEKSMAHVFNPITRASIQIPGIRALPEFSSPYEISVSDINKGIVSSNPSINKNFLVLVSFCGGLAFCKYDDKSWTELDNNHYKDIMFHDGKLFAATKEFLQVWDFEKSSPKKIIHIKDSASPRSVNHNPDTCLPGSVHDTYLVGSPMDEILRMKKCCPYMTSHFLVEKLNSAEKKWETMQNLGDQILFLFYKQLMLLPNQCFFGCEENSIYFGTRDCVTHHCGQEIGIYNLEDNVVRTTKPFCILVLDKHLTELKFCYNGEHFWMVPSPW